MSTYTIGVDLGIRKIAYALHDGDTLYLTGAYDAPGGHRAAQISNTVDYLDSVVYELAHALGVTDEINIFIEEPLIGNNRAYSMQIAQVYGALLDRLWDYSRPDRDPLLPVLRIFGVNVSTWKKQVVGDGRAAKEDVRNYISVVNQRYADLCDRDQDRYDAACVCLYGVLVAARAEGLTHTTG